MRINKRVITQLTNAKDKDVDDAMTLLSTAATDNVEYFIRCCLLQLDCLLRLDALPILIEKVRSELI